MMMRSKRWQRSVGLTTLLICIVMSFHHNIGVLTSISGSILEDAASLGFASSTHLIESRSLTTISPLRRRETISCQTRRNVTVTLPTHIPDFIIAGVAKGGTTALQGFLKQHPLIQESYAFETHFFDARMRVGNKFPKYRELLGDPGSICEVRRQYQEFFPTRDLVEKDDRFFFEKTPVYFVSEDIAETIKAVVPWVKIVVVLRHPADRAYSHFKLLYERGELPNGTTFEEQIAKDMQILQVAGIRIPKELLDSFPIRLNPHARRRRRPRGELWKKFSIMYRGFYAEQLKGWLDHFTLGQNLRLVHFERMEQDPQRVLNEICDFAGVPHYEYPQDVLAERYNPNEKRGPTRDWTPEMSDQMRDFLTRFYQHFNEDLPILAGREWQGVWDPPSEDALVIRKVAADATLLSI